MRPQVISNGHTGNVLIAAGSVARLSTLVLIPTSLGDDRSSPYFDAWHDWPFCIFIGLLFAGGVSFSFMVRSGGGASVPVRGG